MTTATCWPRAARAAGNDPSTSPKPPVLAKGVASDATIRILMASRLAVAVHRVQHAIDKCNRFIARELPRQLQRLVDHHRGRRLLLAHFVNGEPEDITVHGGHALNPPVG